MLRHSLRCTECSLNTGSSFTVDSSFVSNCIMQTRLWFLCSLFSSQEEEYKLGPRVNTALHFHSVLKVYLTKKWWDNLMQFINEASYPQGGSSCNNKILIIIVCTSEYIRRSLPKEDSSAELKYPELLHIRMWCSGSIFQQSMLEKCEINNELTFPVWKEKMEQYVLIIRQHDTCYPVGCFLKGDSSIQNQRYIYLQWQSSLRVVLMSWLSEFRRYQL